MRLKLIFEYSLSDRAFHRQRHLLEHNAIVHKAVHLAIRYTQLFQSRGCTSFNWNHIDLKSLTRMRSRYTVIQSYSVRYQISPNISLSSFSCQGHLSSSSGIMTNSLFLSSYSFFNLNLSFRKPEGYLSSQEVADRSLRQGPEIQLELPNDIYAN